MTKTAYCSKCKKKVEIENPRQEKMKNGNGIIKGTCPNCKGNVSVFGKLDAHAEIGSAHWDSSDLQAQQQEINNPEKKLAEEIKREIEQAPEPIKNREEEYYLDKNSEEEKVENYQEEANNNPILDKYHKKVVDSRAFNFYKIATIIFLIILILFVCAAFSGKLQSNVSLNPNFNATINNNYDFKPTTTNQVYLNATIVIPSINVNANLNLSNSSG